MTAPGSDLALVFHFGSRSGGYVALAFFGSMFAALGWAVARELRRRVGMRRSWAAAVGFVLGSALLAVTYLSSLDGFYEAELRGTSLTFHYLIATTPRVVALESISDVRGTPAFRGLWRLRVVSSRGGDYDSATSDRDVVKAASERLRSVIANLPPPR